jgi:Mg/Co/Ni transporter MgtE
LDRSSATERATQTAAHHLVSGRLRAHPAEAVGSEVARLRQGPYDALDTVLVVDERDRLIGLVGLTTLLAQPDDRLIQELVTAAASIRARLDEDQERVASAAIAADVTLVPVTDADGMPLPWVLCRLGMDPALGAGPLATIIHPGCPEPPRLLHRRRVPGFAVAGPQASRGEFPVRSGDAVVYTETGHKDVTLPCFI